MNSPDTSLLQALLALFAGGSELWEIVLLSLRVSLTALLISTLIGLPLAALMATRRFRGEQILTVFFTTLMALPTVVVGLCVYLMLSRSGPLGVFGLLYTPTAMIIAQIILIIPIVVAMGRQHLELEWLRIGEQLRSLGVPPARMLLTLFWESRLPLVSVLLAGFARAVTEIGAVMIVGGNIDHLTRVMTTAIALETSKGNLELALALGIVLLLLSLLINSLVHAASRWKLVPSQ